MTNPDTPRAGEPQEGRVLGGRYRLGRLLGTGSFGRVYEGHHTSLAQRVAIKVFRNDVVAHAGGPDRVLVDAKAASRVHHRNIVDVHDIGRFEDTVYVATELVLGTTLHAWLVRSGRLPWSRTREVALQIAAALKAAHKRHVLHRGLRAANCFVLEGSTPTAELRIKISDFGFAHPGMAGGEHGEEHTSPFVGDASYVAPELAHGAAASVHSDIYAFGVLLYRVLTGSLPFEGSTPYQVLEAHVTRPVPPPRDKLRSISAEVEAIVLRALAKDPRERFESVRELELALEEAPAQPHDEREDAAPSATLDEVVTGQHVHAPPQAPPPPARDEAMHAAFERRDEPGEQVPTSMFDRRNLVPYFGPAEAAETAPEPTIQLGPAMLLRLAAPAPVPAAAPAPALVPAPAFVSREPDAAPQFAFPQLMPGVTPQASAFPNLMPESPEATTMLGAGHGAGPGMEAPERTVRLSGGGHPEPASVAMPEPTRLLSQHVGAFAPPERTTLLSPPSAGHARGALLPPVERREDRLDPSPALEEGATTTFPARAVRAVAVSHASASPQPLAGARSSMQPAPVVAPAVTPASMIAVQRSVPVAPAAGGYAPMPAHAPHHNTHASPQPHVAMPRPLGPARPSAPPSISAASLAIIAAAVTIAGVLVGLALACPARAASCEPSPSTSFSHDGATCHVPRPSSQDR